MKRLLNVEIDRCGDCIYHDAAMMRATYCQHPELHDKSHTIMDMNGNMLVEIVEDFPTWCPLKVVVL